jgi:dephospho-CoA kinase
MKVIGLTGGYKTGKSTVAGEFAKLGALIIDADKLAHQALEPASGIYRKIITEFSDKILDERGRISRKKLAEEVFNDQNKLNSLNAIVHPYVIKKMKEELSRIEKNDPEAKVVIDLPLLYEAGVQNLMDKIIVVSSTRDKQLMRAKQATRLSERQINRRIESQFPLDKKGEMADAVIDNSGDLEETRKQVVKIWKQIKE